MAGQNISFDRGFFTKKTRATERLRFDPAFSKYTALKNFFTEMSKIQTALVNKQDYTTATGIRLNLSNPTQGDFLALSVHFETLDATKNAILGLADADLNNQKRILTQLQ